MLSVLAFSAQRVQAFSLPDFSGLGQAAADAAARAVCISARPKVYNKFIVVNTVCRSQYDRFNAVLSRLATIIHDAGNNGYDVAQLNSDRTIMLGKFSLWNADCTNMYNALKPVSTFTCNTDTNQDLDHLKARVEAARGYIDRAKDHSQEVKSYYREVIRGDINTLKDQQYQD